MREIKFRGKRVDNGEWVYGDLAHNYDSYIKDSKDLVDDLYRGWFKVVDNTVGQYTGLKDRNGREIYEGDIINLTNTAGVSINVVCEFGTARRVIFENTVDITGCYFKLSNGEKTFPIVSNYAGKHDLDLFEIIGNIYENPELLER